MGGPPKALLTDSGRYFDNICPNLDVKLTPSYPFGRLPNSQKIIRVNLDVPWDRILGGIFGTPLGTLWSHSVESVALPVGFGWSRAYPP